MIRVGVFGATGYAGFELVQLLRRHPAARLVFATSEASAGGHLGDSHPCPDDVVLVAAEEAPLDAVDCVFCSLPHGASAVTVKRAWEAGCQRSATPIERFVHNWLRYTHRRWGGVRRNFHEPSPRIRRV